MPAATETRLSLIGRLHELTLAMKAAATRQDWDELIAAEARRRELETALRAMANTPGDANDAQSAALLAAVIADDAAIRAMVSDWMNDTRKWLGDTGRERALQAAYGTPP